MEHSHYFRLKKANVQAFYRKDNWPGDTAYFVSGDLEICSCGSRRIKPYGDGLSEVEVMEARNFARTDPT